MYFRGTFFQFLVLKNCFIAYDTEKCVAAHVHQSSDHQFSPKNI